MANRVRMLESRLGSEDGYTVKRFMRGRVYEVSDFLLEAFILGGSVEIIDSPPDDGFIEPYDYGGHNEDGYETKVVTPEKRGPGRPRKNAV